MSDVTKVQECRKISTVGENLLRNPLRNIYSKRIAWY
ncbi:hypothetical protein Twillingate_066 [Staphylococcus phage Twillingate]|nr:hypothetical protein Twillingate_066 [Staphylococcus phage Twillingate]